MNLASAAAKLRAGLAGKLSENKIEEAVVRFLEENSGEDAIFRQSYVDWKIKLELEKV